jgi:antitoxin YefM
MAIYTSYEHFRKNITAFLDKVENGCETLIIQRPGYEDVVIMTVDDYRGLEETEYLLHSRPNADRILSALANVKAGKHSPMTIEELKREVGFRDEDF